MRVKEKTSFDPNAYLDGSFRFGLHVSFLASFEPQVGIRPVPHAREKLAAYVIFEDDDMTDVISLSETQLQTILKTLESLKSSGWHLDQFIPIFLGALSGILVGLFMEVVRWNHEKTKSAKERSKKEVEQINVALVGIIANIDIEMLMHWTSYYFVPYYDDSHGAHNELNAIIGNEERVSQFLLSLDKYHAIMTVAPEMYLVKIYFLDKLSFIVEKDPELLKQTIWTANLSRILKTLILESNKQIEIVHNILRRENGQLSLYQLGNTLQCQESISESECVTALQLMQHYLNVVESMGKLSNTYNIQSGRLKVTLPKQLKDVKGELTKRVGHLMP